MAKELSGYGPTAGESMGGTGANLNQQGGNNNSNSGVHWGGGSGHGNNGGQGNSNSSGSTSTVMKTGESYLTPWGDVVINNDGLPVMNGIVMTEENSTLVDNPFGGVSRVLNSLISDMPSLFAESSGNNNNNTASVNTAPTNAQVSDMDKSSKVVGNVINEKQKQKNKIATQISEKQKKIEEMKKVFKHHSYHGITDLERDVDELQKKSNQLDADISKLNSYKNTLQSKIGDVNKQKEAEEKARENAEVAEHETLNEEKQAVAEAEKRLAEAKAELAKAESDVQSKQATVSRVAGELENAQKSVDVKVTGFLGWRDVQKKLQRQLEAKQAEYSAVENELKNAVSFRDGKAAEVKEAEQKLKEAQDALEKSQIKDAVDTMVGFYQYITEQYGEKYAKIAQDLAEKSKGKKIQGVDEALAAFEKYKNVLDKKFSKVDRDAIFNALESVNYDELSKNLTKISKSLKITSRVSFLYDVGSDFKNAIETGNWRPLFVTLEKSAVDVGVAKIVALMFSFIVGVPLGFWGIAIVTGIVSSYIGDDELSKLNELLGI
ncbi:TPA: pore-forming bacteriocin colicin K [Escherichia coli]|uniref:pore-forming bacteriocin colicin K n=1 Tax=Enterobacterales TaxID=91347 RepID=UPI0006588B3F|nr:pore-forming bacteriocin colicin K [Escherichia coli]EKK9272689.1 pore-forming bacteriocin colicin K [Salmonella enterica]EFS3090702.1 pore-forming bacteriocin colicin K [Escherichia coli]EFT2128306.1 pore-forming bacteriocin colicin K [Escherichia coli]EHA1014825.1 pore-forming bacteriocin colicin K [Escherichia coli]EHD2885361.1 pore-forming bacteriocin colicin K [Escherichia coli]